MPFVFSTYNIKEPKKAFLYLIKEHNFSMSKAQKYIDCGRILINDNVIKNKSSYISGQVKLLHFAPNPIGLKPLYVEQNFVIYDKPKGIPVYPQNRKNTHSLLDDIKYTFGNNANITHRIDKETSGLLLVSLNKKAEIQIKKMFENKQISKEYVAFVKGHLKSKTIIDKPLSISKNRSFGNPPFSFIDTNGKKSTTIVYPLYYERKKDTTYCKIIPKSGRMHQIRAHLYSIGHAILGDHIYSAKKEDSLAFLDGKLSTKQRQNIFGANRLMLNANAISFVYKDKNLYIKSKITLDINNIK